MLDIVLKNATVYDGTGSPWFRADVALEGGLIASVRNTIKEGARRVIDLRGKALTPGFIDLHSHSDLLLLREPLAEPKIRQGVTTEVIGQDGLGTAPVPRELQPFWSGVLSGVLGGTPEDALRESFSEYLSMLERRLAINVVSLVGHACLRLAVIGMEKRAPSGDELKTMSSLLSEALREGARGLSTGLVYPPCSYAETSELAALCKELVGKNAVFMVHIRNEGAGIFEALDEVCEVARRAEIPIHIAHLKVAGTENWGRAGELLERIEKLRREFDITFDQYPYTAGSTTLTALLPDWVHEGGGILDKLKSRQNRRKIIREIQQKWQLEQLRISSVGSEANKHLQGKSFAELGAIRGQDPWEAVLDLLIEENLEVSISAFLMKEEDVEAIMKHPLTMFASDGIPGSHPHPRLYGSFPRVLGRYSRQKSTLRLEEAIRKMTSAPARLLGLSNRGIIREGFAGDLVCFAPDSILDRATYENPIRFPYGIELVIVNGQIVLENGERKDAYPGAVL